MINPKKVKMTIGIISVLTGMMSGAAIADTLSNLEHYVDAEVISIKPRMITERVPYKRCRVEMRPMVGHFRHTVDGSGTVIGGVTGGLLGHQIGQGNGNVAATIGGAVVGALVGNHVERDMNRPEVRYVPVHVCKTFFETRSTIKGYDVTYRYNGQQGTTFMKKKPKGDHIHLQLMPVAS